MVIKGLSKLTLLDYPGKVACTVFTGGCNLRCPFCHNASLVLRPGEVEGFSEDEVLSFLKKRQGILDGVCITGGEPLLQTDIADFLRKVKALGYAVKLDTNGFFPERMIPLIEEGLIDRVAVDVKNSLSKYAETVGIPDIDLTPFKKTVDYLLSGKVDYEFRTTVVNELHTEQDIAEIADLIDGAAEYHLQCFVDSGDLIGSHFTTKNEAEMRALLAIVKPRMGISDIRGL